MLGIVDGIRRAKARVKAFQFDIEDEAFTYIMSDLQGEESRMMEEVAKLRAHWATMDQTGRNLNAIDDVARALLGLSKPKQ